MAKGFSAGQMLEQGRARTQPGHLPNVETSRHLDVTASKPQQEPKYDRVTVYLTPEQREWIGRAADRASDGRRNRYSASDVIRLGIEKLQELADPDITEALSVQAWTEAEKYPGRLKKGMPPKPKGWS